MARLCQTFNMSSHHRSAVALKVNLLISHQRPSRWLLADDFERFSLDFIQMGNGYRNRVAQHGQSRGGGAGSRPARHMRVGIDEGGLLVRRWADQRAGSRIPPRHGVPPAAAGRGAGSLWPAGMAIGAAIGAAQRERHAVPPPLLP